MSGTWPAHAWDDWSIKASKHNIRKSIRPSVASAPSSACRGASHSLSLTHHERSRNMRHCSFSKCSASCKSLLDLDPAMLSSSMAACSAQGWRHQFCFFNLFTPIVSMNWHTTLHTTLGFSTPHSEGDSTVTVHSCALLKAIDSAAPSITIADSTGV